jgi:hypothetical protein
MEGEQRNIRTDNSETLSDMGLLRMANIEDLSLLFVAPLREKFLGK